MKTLLYKFSIHWSFTQGKTFIKFSHFHVSFCKGQCVYSCLAYNWIWHCTVNVCAKVQISNNFAYTHTCSLKIANLQSSQILLYCIQNLETVIDLSPENLGNGLYSKVSANIHFRHQMVNSNFALTYLSKKPRFLRHYARSVSSAFGIPKKKEAITPCTKTSAAYLDGIFQGGIKKEASTQRKLYWSYF